MKKGEAKKLITYMLVAIFIVTFLVRTIFVTANYVEDKIRMSYLYEENANKPEYVEYLQWLQDWIYNTADNVADIQGDDYPAVGAVLEQTNILDGIYEMRGFVICIISGAIIGIAYYIMKKDNKKVMHYIAIHILFFAILVLAIITLGSLSEMGATFPFASLTIGTIDSIELLKLVGVIIIPYTVVYLLICVIVYLVNKKRTEKLNEYVK